MDFRYAGVTTEGYLICQYIWVSVQPTVTARIRHHSHTIPPSLTRCTDMNPHPLLYQRRETRRHSSSALTDHSTVQRRKETKKKKRNCCVLSNLQALGNMRVPCACAVHTWPQLGAGQPLACKYWSKGV